MSRKVLDEDSIKRCLTRVAHEIVERNPVIHQVALIGIRTRGVTLSQRLQGIINNITGFETPLAVLDINLYRDDLSRVSNSPVIGRTQIDFSLEDRVIVLVDDVLYTGRTTRAALDALVAFGRPKRIQLAVLVDRGHRELPIRADYVGKNVPTSSAEIIFVKLNEIDFEEEVLVGYQS